jgi:hypothetical protein
LWLSDIIKKREVFGMPMWMFPLILVGGLLLFGFVIDIIAKKKNLQLDPEEGLKAASESERILKEQYLDQIKDNMNNPNF